MKSTEPKSRRLLNDDRDDIMRRFTDAYHKKAREYLEPKRAEIAQKVWDAMWTEEEKAALKVLDRFNRPATFSVYVRTKDGVDKDGGVLRGKNYCIHMRGEFRMPPYYGNNGALNFIPQEIADEIDAYDSEDRKWNNAFSEARHELRSLISRCKTRRQFAEAWEPAADLMGDEWIRATEGVAMLPAVSTTQLNAVYEAIKPITKTAESVAA